MGSTKRQRKTISTGKMKNFNSDNFLSDLGQIDCDSMVSSSKIMIRQSTSGHIFSH